MRPIGLLPLLALGGCGLDTLLFGGPSVERPPEPLPPPRGDSSAKIDLEAGLAPLPSRQQVLGSVSFGRSDPFGATAPPPVTASASPAGPVPPGSAPAASNATPGSGPSGTQGTASTAVAPTRSSAQGRAKPSRRPAPLRPPAGFQLTGVIRSGGQAEALVSFGTSSGSLRPGERGGRNTALLPAGWSLASIQLGGRSLTDAPSITLLKAGQRVKVSLGGADRLQIQS